MNSKTCATFIIQFKFRKCLTYEVISSLGYKVWGLLFIYVNNQDSPQNHKA